MQVAPVQVQYLRQMEKHHQCKLQRVIPPRVQGAFWAEESPEPFHAEFKTHTKWKLESWADFADDLKSLVDKAYPELEEVARERLAVNQYLQQLEHPQVTSSVKLSVFQQKQPAKLDEAVSAMLEMEAYTLKPGCV